MATPAAPASGSGSTPASASSQPAQGAAAASGSSPAQASAPGQGAQPTAAEIRKLKLKLEGQEIELPESEVIALAQKGKVADRRFQEAAALNKKAEELLKLGNENPAEFLKRTGKTPRQWAEEYLMEQLKLEQMSPAEKKALENEEELRRYKKAEKDADEEKKRKADADLEEKHVKRYNELFVEALQQSGLPKTPFTVKRMAELQKTNLKLGLELPADRLAKLVREDYIAEQKALFGAVEGDQLIELLGADVVKKLSKAQIAKLKAKGVSRSSTGKFSSPAKEEPQMTWREYQRRNRRLP